MEGKSFVQHTGFFYMKSANCTSSKVRVPKIFPSPNFFAPNLLWNASNIVGFLKKVVHFPKV